MLIGWPVYFFSWPLAIWFSFGCRIGDVAGAGVVGAGAGD